jgi:protein-tyrosine-phosphatase
VREQESKTLDRDLDQRPDAVITGCDQANEACPVFSGASQRLHWSFSEPSKATGSENQRLEVYREVRDGLRPARLTQSQGLVWRDPERANMYGHGMVTIRGIG